MTDKINEYEPSQEMIKLIALAGFDSQAEMARVLEVRSATISDYKLGKKAMTVNTLKLWCKKLNVDIKYLF